MANFERARAGVLREQLHVWDEFRGLDLKDAPLLIPKKFAQKANFVDIGLLGAVRKALGPTKINTAQITDNPAVYGLHEYWQTDGDKFFIVYTDDGKLWSVQYTSGVFTELDLASLTLAADANNISMATFNNLCIIGDGTNVPIYAYRDVLEGATDPDVLEDMYELGIDQPAANPTTAIGAAGNLTGFYGYKVIFVSDTGAKGAPKAGAGSVTDELTTDRVDLTDIALNADVKRNVVAREIYRTLELAEAADEPYADYFYLTTVDNNTTTVFTDNIWDSALAEPLVEDRDPPVAGLMGFTEYNGSLYGFVKGSHELRYSEPNNSEAWSAYAVEPISPGDGQVITGLGTLNDLVIFKERSIHSWSGIIGFFSRRKKASGIGAVSHQTIKNVDLPTGGDVLFFLSQWGPYFFDEQDPYPVGREIEPIFTGKDDNYNITHAAIHLAKAEYIFDEKKYFLSIPVNTSEENNLLLIYDVFAKSWHVREPFYCGALSLRTDIANQAKVVGGESRDDSEDGGYIFTLEDADDYLGEDFRGEYVTAWTHCGQPNNKKMAKFLEIDMVARAEEAIYVDLYFDGGSVPVLTRTVSQQLVGSKWDGANWDEGVWSGDNFNTAIIGLENKNFRQIAVGFRTDQKDRPWQILQSRLRYTMLPAAGTRL